MKVTSYTYSWDVIVSFCFLMSLIYVLTILFDSMVACCFLYRISTIMPCWIICWHKLAMWFQCTSWYGSKSWPMLTPPKFRFSGSRSVDVGSHSPKTISPVQTLFGLVVWNHGILRLSHHIGNVSTAQLTFPPWFFRVGWNHQPVLDG